MTRGSSLDQDPITVLHVDDDEQARLLFQRNVERADGAFTVHSIADPATALERLDDDIDCIVSDYEMPRMNGVELLRAVRADRPELPFILLTGRGSEAIASEAISAGLTDYFQKSDIARQFPVLAQRIENAVEGTRAEVSYRELFEMAADGFALVEPDTGAFVDANPAFRDLLGLEQAAVLSMDVSDIPVLDRQESTLADYLRRAAKGDTTSTETRCQRPDGERFWMELQFKPIEVKGRSLILTQASEITERKRYERTLSALHTAVTDIVAAERSQQVIDSVLSAVDDLLAADRAAVFRHVAAENRLVAVGTTSPTGDTGEIPLDPTHPFARAFIQGHSVESEGMSVLGSTDQTTAHDRTLVVPIGAAGVLTVGYTDTAEVVGDDREFAAILTNAAAAAFERIEKEQEIHSGQEEIRHQASELQRLERVNATLRELNDSLVHAETRDDVFETVCRQLSGIEGVTLAWIGVPTDGRMDPRAWAGDVPQYLDTAPLDIASSEEPAVVAARSGRTVRVANTATDIQRQPWRRTALSHGVESVVAMPIEVDSVVYGVLSVMSEDQAAFSGRFEGSLSAIAAAVGETLHSIEQRQDLQSDDTVEVTFELASDDHPLGRLAAAADCTLDVTGVIAEPESTCRIFAAVRGAPPADVTEAAAAMSAVRSASVATDDGTTGAIELQLEIPLLGAPLREYPVRIAELSASPDRVQVALEIAQPAVVRDVASGILDQYPSARLQSKRTQADDRNDYERLLAFRNSLTPRQREVIHMAYLNGYFESPRQCTGTELGEKLGISSQAVYQHLRAAQRQLFGEAFRQIRTVSPPSE